MKFMVGVCLLAALLGAGCVSYEYDGIRESEPTAQVTVFTDSSKIGRQYQVLGQATVSGNYQDVSRERLIAKLENEAKSAGADAVLIVEQQVTPGLVQKDQPLFNTAFDYDDEAQSWRMLYRDVNLNYTSSANTGTVVNYKRIIRAEFIRYTAGKPQADQAK
ncbi:MAG: hypothetical protein PHI35_03825 [Victivallaceae bacterium]|nr:hypothetical protein [Victivallaceae bacterium]